MIRFCRFSWFMFRFFNRCLILMNLKQCIIMWAAVSHAWLHWHVSILKSETLILFKKAVKSIHFEQIYVIRKLSILCRFLCNLRVLWFDDFMSIKFQINRFISHFFLIMLHCLLLSISFWTWVLILSVLNSLHLLFFSDKVFVCIVLSELFMNFLACFSDHFLHVWLFVLTVKTD